MTTRFKSIIKATTSLTTRFNRDECGALALMLALAAVPSFVVAGVALDTFRTGSANAQVQASLDAAALAAAAAEPSTSERARRKLAEDTFAANINSEIGKQLNGSPDISFTTDAVTVAYNAKLPTTVMKIGGFESLNVSGSSTATLLLLQKAEIVLWLDYSGSMNDLSNGAKK